MKADVKGPGRIPITAWNVVRDTIHEVAPEREEELIEALVARLRGYRPAAGRNYTSRACARCGEPLDPGARLDKIYCSDRCRIAHKRAAQITHPFAPGDKVRFTGAATDTRWEVWQAHSRGDYHWCAVVSEKGHIRHHVNAGRLEKIETEEEQR